MVSIVLFVFLKYIYFVFMFILYLISDSFYDSLKDAISIPPLFLFRILNYGTIQRFDEKIWVAIQKMER